MLPSALAFAESVPALSKMYELHAGGPYTTDDQGRMLWTSLDHAMTYANVRAIVHRSRQTIEVVNHLGATTYWVRKARSKVAEPCS